MEANTPASLQKIESKEGITKCGKVEKVGLGEHEFITTAYEMSGCDKDFVLLLEAENGLWSHKRRHNPSANTVGVDYGFCGINDYYHKEIVNDSRFTTDWKWQMGKCLELYKGGVTFYGKKRKEIVRKNIIFK